MDDSKQSFHRISFFEGVTHLIETLVQARFKVFKGQIRPLGLVWPVPARTWRSLRLVPLLRSPLEA